MKSKAKSDNVVFTGVKIISWIIFIGLCIESGGLLVNFIFSLFKPEMVHNLYQKLDLSGIYAQSTSVFYSMYGFILTISILKAVLFYFVIVLITKIKLARPFDGFVSKQFYNISYYTLAIGLLSIVARQVAKYLERSGYVTDNLDQFWADSQAFIMMSAVIYVLSTIFSKGVEYQEELEETV